MTGLFLPIVRRFSDRWVAVDKGRGDIGVQDSVLESVHAFDFWQNKTPGNGADSGVYAGRAYLAQTDGPHTASVVLMSAWRVLGKPVVVIRYIEA